MLVSDRAIRDEAQLWRIRHEDGLSADEEAQFRAWYVSSDRHADAFVEAELFWIASQDPDFREATLKELERLDSTAEPINMAQSQYKADRSSVIARALVGVTAMAAVVAACIMVLSPGALFPDAEPEFERFVSGQSQVRIVRLPDKTKITMSASSDIEVSLSDTARLIKLNKGTVFFEVASDASRPFTVNTALADVLVTGTKFDVQLRSDEVAIAVGEGSVEVSGPAKSPASERPIAISKGQAIKYRSQSGFGEVTEVFAAEIAAWRDGRLVYVEAPLSRVIEDLNRYSDKPITAEPSIGALKISGIYDVNDLDAALEAIEQSLPARVVDDRAQKRFVME